MDFTRSVLVFVKGRLLNVKSGNKTNLDHDLTPSLIKFPFLVPTFTFIRV